VIDVAFIRSRHRLELRRNDRSSAAITKPTGLMRQAGVELAHSGRPQMLDSGWREHGLLGLGQVLAKVLRIPVDESFKNRIDPVQILKEKAWDGHS